MKQYPSTTRCDIDTLWTGLPTTLWAAAVPMNYERPVRDLLQDIAGDDAYMKQQRGQQV